MPFARCSPTRGIAAVMQAGYDDLSTLPDGIPEPYGNCFFRPRAARLLVELRKPLAQDFLDTNRYRHGFIGFWPLWCRLHTAILGPSINTTSNIATTRNGFRASPVVRALAHRRICSRDTFVLPFPSQARTITDETAIP
jgi:hypothetical protein